LVIATGGYQRGSTSCCHELTSKVITTRNS